MALGSTGPVNTHTRFPIRVQRPYRDLRPSVRLNSFRLEYLNDFNRIITKIGGGQLQLPFAGGDDDRHKARLLLG